MSAAAKGAMTTDEALSRLTAAGAAGVMDVTAVPAETADAESARWLLELSAQADAEGDIKFAVYLADAAAWHAGEGL